MYKLPLVLCVSFLFLFNFNLFPSCYKEPVYGKMADKISANTAKILSKRHKMCLSGTGGGFIDHVNMLALSFDIRRPLTQDKVREIIVDCIEEFLAQINSDEEIQPFLKNYPFTPANIEIRIFVFTQEGKAVYDPYISVVSSITKPNSERTILWYRTVAPDQSSGYKTEIDEDYGEALRIVKESKKLLLDQSKCQSATTQTL